MKVTIWGVGLFVLLTIYVLTVPSWHPEMWEVHSGMDLVICLYLAFGVLLVLGHSIPRLWKGSKSHDKA